MNDVSTIIGHSLPKWQNFQHFLTTYDIELSADNNISSFTAIAFFSWMWSFTIIRLIVASMSFLANCIKYIFSNLYYQLFVYPLLLLYLNGPEFYNIGFWSGKNHADICSVLTNTESAFWQKNSSACDDLIHRRFQSFVLFVTIMAYFYSFYKIIHFVFTRYYYYCQQHNSK